MIPTDTSQSHAHPDGQSSVDSGAALRTVIALALIRPQALERLKRLIRNKKDRHISELKDGAVGDLANFVELTPTGERWIKRVREIEETSNSPGV
jgi:hypothetical protein